METVIGINSQDNCSIYKMRDINNDIEDVKIQDFEFGTFRSGKGKGNKESKNTSD